MHRRAAAIVFPPPVGPTITLNGARSNSKARATGPAKLHVLCSTFASDTRNASLTPTLFDRASFGGPDEGGTVQPGMNLPDADPLREGGRPEFGGGGAEGGRGVRREGVGPLIHHQRAARSSVLKTLPYSASV